MNGNFSMSPDYLKLLYSQDLFTNPLTGGNIEEEEEQKVRTAYGSRGMLSSTPMMNALARLKEKSTANRLGSLRDILIRGLEAGRSEKLRGEEMSWIGGREAAGRAGQMEQLQFQAEQQEKMERLKLELQKELSKYQDELNDPGILGWLGQILSPALGIGLGNTLANLLMPKSSKTSGGSDWLSMLFSNLGKTQVKTQYGGQPSYLNVG